MMKIKKMVIKNMKLKLQYICYEVINSVLFVMLSNYHPT